MRHADFTIITRFGNNDCIAIYRFVHGAFQIILIGYLIDISSGRRIGWFLTTTCSTGDFINNNWLVSTRLEMGHFGDSVASTINNTI